MSDIAAHGVDGRGLRPGPRPPVLGAGDGVPGGRRQGSAGAVEGLSVASGTMTGWCRRSRAAQARRVAVVRAGLQRADVRAARSPARTCGGCIGADPGAAARLGVGGGARALRAGVQPARRRTTATLLDDGRVASQRALAAAAGRVLGARGGADGRSRTGRCCAGGCASTRHGRWGTRDRQEEPASWPRTSSRRSRSSGRRRRGHDRGAPGDRSRAGARAPWWDRSETKWVGRGAVVARGC